MNLYSGRESGLNIKAEEAIMGFAFTQAGATAGQVAVGGSLSYFEQDSDTLAHLAEGSVIRGAASMFMRAASRPRSTGQAVSPRVKRLVLVCRWRSMIQTAQHGL